MHKRHHILALGVALAALGCGSADQDALLDGQSTAGSAAEQPQQWRGLQSCKGEAGHDEILSSDETEIEDYAPSKTRVQLKGVLVGTADYTCGPLDLDGVVTSTTVATSFESPMKHSCTSPSGRPLVVSELDGYDLDQRSAAAAGGKWNLAFDLRVQDEEVDGGAADRADITCHFEVSLQ